MSWKRKPRRSRRDDGPIDLGAYAYRAPSFNSIRLNGPDCILSFTATPGSLYVLQRATNPSDYGWFPVLSQLPGADTPLEVIDTNATTDPHRFYRVKTL